ncbi:DUF262 domain-containing protein [Betaproteobacteria bacterium PRO4]|nr:DUF262 domain-containing protein [Betaproteobacteria bacterium PRO4]
MTRRLMPQVYSIRGFLSTTGLGALVVIKDGMRSGTIPAFKLVDGQQRLTTISLFLCALGNLVEGTHPALFRKIRRLLENPDEQGSLRFKLVPTTKYGDREAYKAIICGDGVNGTESRITSAYDFIYKQLKSRISANRIDPERLFLVLANCMHVVFIDLDQRERPYEIFESLNAKGKPLSQPDLVRNYIAMKLPEAKQEAIFETYWSAIENKLRENRTVSRIGELTAFLRHYLAYRTGMLFNKDHIYARFRDRMEKDFANPETFMTEIQTLHRFAGYYDCLLRPEMEVDPDAREVLNRLNILESATAYPFILGMYENLKLGVITRQDFLDGLYSIENYLVRRYLAGDQSGYTNKMFPSLDREIDRSRFAASLQQALIRKNYPPDNRIRQALLTLQLYDKRKPQRLVLILETVNRHLSAGTGGHTVLDDIPTIEHIMPQSMSDHWKHELGGNWEEVHRDYLHTLGNVTLVTQEWNSSLSNSPYVQKKQRLARHALLLNSLYFNSDIPVWNEDAIKARATHLTDVILEIWPSFGEPPSRLNPSGQKPKAITIIGETYDVKSWREVAFHMAACIATIADDFDEVATNMPGFFSREERHRARQMANGWWVYLNLSSASVVVTPRDWTGC